MKLTATVRGGVGTPTGTVVFRDGVNVIAACASATLSAGIAQCTTTSLSSGARSITAQYSGDSACNASTSGALVQTVKGSSLDAVIICCWIELGAINAISDKKLYIWRGFQVLLG